jgi:hypothetical protein
MPVSPYGGILFASLVAIGGAAEVETAASNPMPSEILLAADESVVLQNIKAICARKDAEVISASADPDRGTSLHLALVDSDGNFRADGLIGIAGQQLLGPEMRLRCRGDWLMMQMKPGEYMIKAEINGRQETRSVVVPRYGRVRVAMNMGDTPNS